MWEGQVANGVPMGFNRYIDGQKDTSFIGYSENFEEEIYGTCLLFKDKKLVRSGVFIKDEVAGENVFKQSRFTEFSDDDF